jgi:enoyl-CoA hydratase/carnithine racemase
MDLPLGRGLEAETEASNRVFDSDDMVEGARAFLEKRPPQFHGR